MLRHCGMRWRFYTRPLLLVQNRTRSRPAVQSHGRAVRHDRHQVQVNMSSALRPQFLYSDDTFLSILLKCLQDP